jgi:hypothetical protein
MILVFKTFHVGMEISKVLDPLVKNTSFDPSPSVTRLQQMLGRKIDD